MRSRRSLDQHLALVRKLSEPKENTSYTLESGVFKLSGKLGQRLVTCFLRHTELSTNRKTSVV